MIYLRFAGAAAALVWGLCTAFRPRVPLYYKIVFFGMASCFLGSCYEALARLLADFITGLGKEAPLCWNC